MTTGDSDIYYDPYDFDIDADPYPLWHRMRDEAPLYFNEKYDFYALTRFDDVEPGLLDGETYRSGKGSVLEIIRADSEVSPGIILWEDPRSTTFTAASCRAFSRRRRCWRSSPKSVRSAPGRSIRSWGPVASTSSPISVHQCRCG